MLSGIYCKRQQQLDLAGHGRLESDLRPSTDFVHDCNTLIGFPGIGMFWSIKERRVLIWTAASGASEIINITPVK